MINVTIGISWWTKKKYCNLSILPKIYICVCVCVSCLNFIKFWLIIQVSQPICYKWTEDFA